MTKQVLDMVERLKKLNEAKDATGEFITALLETSNVLVKVREGLKLEHVESLEPLYEQASRHLTELCQLVRDADQIVNFRVKVESDDASETSTPVS